jgi:hypothetical protein
VTCNFATVAWQAGDFTHTFFQHASCSLRSCILYADKHTRAVGGFSPRALRTNAVARWALAQIPRAELLYTKCVVTYSISCRDASGSERNARDESKMPSLHAYSFSIYRCQFIQPCEICSATLHISIDATLLPLKIMVDHRILE